MKHGALKHEASLRSIARCFISWGMARNDPQVNLRMPADLKERLDAAAQENKRSLTAEVVERLESTFVELERAAMIRSLIEFQADLLDGALELQLPASTLDKLQAEADKRGWSIQRLVNALVSTAIQHLDEGTEIGKKIETHFFDQLGITLPPPDEDIED